MLNVALLKLKHLPAMHISANWLLLSTARGKQQTKAWQWC